MNVPRLSNIGRQKLLMHYSKQEGKKVARLKRLLAIDIDYKIDDYKFILEMLAAIVGKPSPDTKLYIIQSGYVGNHMLFWKRDNCGYTTNLDDAKLWTEMEAKKQAQDREEDIAWPLDYLYQVMEACINLERVDHARKYEG